MFEAGDIVENPVSGWRVLICKTERDTQGAYIEVEYFDRPSAENNILPRHFHPTWTERFEILSGSARYCLGHDERPAEVGEVLTFPAGVSHIHPWNAGVAEELHVRQTTIPAQPDPEGLRAAMGALETLIRLAQVGKVNRNGLPNPLQTAVLVRSMMPNTYLACIPPLVSSEYYSARLPPSAGRWATRRATQSTLTVESSCLTCPRLGICGRGRFCCTVCETARQRIPLWCEAHCLLLL